MTTSTRLRPKDRELLRWVGKYIDEHGYSPSLRECVENTSCSSVSVVAGALKRLEAAGAIAGRRRGTSRTIVVIDGGLGEE